MKNRGHLQNLMGRYLEEIASPAEVAELENALREDPALRREFLRYLAADSALGAAAPAFRIARIEPARTPWLARLPKLQSIATAALLLLLPAIYAFVRRDSVPPPPSQPAGESFATLAAATHAVWEDPNTELSLRAGLLPPGRMRLESGTVEFVCRDGATMALRGPASFQFTQRREIFLESGRIQCRCLSPESRLTVTTPTTEIQDLGTEFVVESRPDHSTRVAVLSGEVQIGKSGTHRLREGQAVELRSDGLRILDALSPEDFATLQITPPEASETEGKPANHLANPGFESPVPSTFWSGTETNIESTSMGRHGRGVRVMARGNPHWPQCHQNIHFPGIAGQLVMASVWASVAPGDPLQGNQTAVLKIAFKNDEGRDFAFVCKRLLGPHSEPGRFEKIQVAAFAPEGTARMQLQLMLQADRREAGSVIFDDATLRITNPPTRQ